MNLQIDELTASVPLAPETVQALADAVRLMLRLRAPGGCPWDRAQDHQSLRQNLLEETYELLHALATRDDAALREELGDLFLQVVFHSIIAAERGAFDLKDVARELVEKLIRRHPHVFGDVNATTPAEALHSWHNAKRSEGEHTVTLSGVPSTMPALLRARKVQQRAAKVGFQWPDVKGALEKLDEELSEMRAAIDSGDASRAEEEMGDVLFVLTCIANYQHFCPEIALTRTVEKFIQRFGYIEKRLAEQGLIPEQATLAQMDGYWEASKRVSE